MITIKVKEKPYIVDDNDYESFSYDLKSIIKIDEGANATEVMGAIYRALIVAGYHTESIANAMYNYAEYLAFQHNFELKEDED